LLLRADEALKEKTLPVIKRWFWR